VLGRGPGFEHVYVATGAGRKGILYGPPMGRAIADLVVGRHARVALEPFAPERFVRT
jgi:glycine/D-amino acid oxidase-like deaminating enzyme